MALPTFQLRDIPEDGIEVDTAIDAATLRGMLEGSEFGPAGDPAGKVHVRIDKHDANVTLTGSVDATLTATCVRCLEPVEVKSHSDFTLFLTPAPAHVDPKRAHTEVDLSADDLDEDHYENDRIELARWVREQILREAPTNPECPNGCKVPIQMPATEEKIEKSIDPRLAPLQQFSKKR
jgi:uncharacterized metal-binding protein YceD (DUF177 family)